MAVENLKSGPITNRDATPRVKAQPFLNGVLHDAVGTVEATAGDATSTYRMFEVPSNCRMTDLRLYTDDLGTTGTLDIGIYRTTADGGAVVDADLFASAVDVNAAALNGTDVLHESGVNNIDDAEKPLWQAAGLTADPGVMYDVVITAAANISTGGTITLKGRYVY